MRVVVAISDRRDKTIRALLARAEPRERGEAERLVATPKHAPPLALKEEYEPQYECTGGPSDLSAGMRSEPPMATPPCGRSDEYEPRYE